MTRCINHIQRVFLFFSEIYLNKAKAFRAHIFEGFGD